MKIVSTVVALSFTWSNFAYAQCVKPVTLLQPKEPAPCRGYLFTPEKELELRLLNEDHKFLTEKLRLKDRQLELMTLELNNSTAIISLERQKAELWRKAAEESTLRLIEKEDKQQTRDWLHILGGIGLTVLAGWAIGQAGK
jgi:hypothetical protein